MLNQVLLVGRLTRDPEVIETENDKKVSNLTVAITRPYKSADGVYDADFIEVRGRIQSDSYEKDGERKFSTRVLAEKISFLQSRAKEEPEPAR